MTFADVLEAREQGVALSFTSMTIHVDYEHCEHPSSHKIELDPWRVVAVSPRRFGVYGWAHRVYEGAIVTLKGGRFYRAVLQRYGEPV